MAYNEDEITPKMAWSAWTKLLSGSQSLIPKVLAIPDMENGVKAVEFFIRTGELYPGIDGV